MFKFVGLLVYDYLHSREERPTDFVLPVVQFFDEKGQVFFGLKKYFASLHLLGMVFLTVGYFTPVWTLPYDDHITKITADHYTLYGATHRGCYSVGLISNFCEGAVRSYLRSLYSYGGFLYLYYFVYTYTIYKCTYMFNLY